MVSTTVTVVATVVVVATVAVLATVAVVATVAVIAVLPLSRKVEWGDVGWGGSGVHVNMRTDVHTESYG